MHLLYGVHEQNISMIVIYCLFSLAFTLQMLIGPEILLHELLNLGQLIFFSRIDISFILTNQSIIWKFSYSVLSAFELFIRKIINNNYE